jgi:alpha-ketoglutarate-dependent taurine dioxygenase
MAHLKTLRNHTQTAIQRTQAMTQKYAERKKGQHHFRPFIEGQQVWLEGMNLCLSHPMVKLHPKQFGPFHITVYKGHQSMRLSHQVTLLLEDT